MNRAIFPLCITTLMLGACGNGGDVETAADAETQEVAAPAPKVSFAPGKSNMTTTKLQGPVRISYRIIGEPIVGQPVAIDLRFESSLGPQPFNVSYRINDATALEFPEVQSEKVTIAPSLGESFAAQQVTVVPMREGRLYLNVAAQVEGDMGSISSVTAVPIQVGQAPRELLENGTVTTDENGELIRSLPAQEN